MDNVTHALAGCLMAAATVAAIERRSPPVSRGVRRTTVLVGVIAAELPDGDLLYSGPVLGMGKLGYLLHHRGHTHTVVFALLGALLVWGAALALRREMRTPALSRPVWWLSLAGTTSHLLLDFTNNYGVHPWWPWDNRWYYGDAVFIVEPWLWIVSLGPLVFLATRWPARVLFGGLLGAILLAAWRVDMVERPVALTLTIGAAAWVTLAARLGAARRLWLALTGWIVVESVCFAASRAGEHRVQQLVGDALRDVVLTPGPGDPTCLRVLAITANADRYVISSGVAAPFPRLRSVDRCQMRGADLHGGAAPLLPGSPALRWDASWEGSIADLRRTAATNCEVAAALRFIRVPIWRPLANGGTQISDARYGEGPGSFASVDAPPRPARCPRFVPGWTPPRQDLLSP